ncbi:MAG: sulfite exporter TauE/SafE family protein [Pseudomonadota bacterium]
MILGVSIALDLWTAAALAAVLLGGFVRGLVGFGSALAMVPVLALVFGPRAAVAMHAIIEIPVILSLLPTAVRDAERRTVAPMLLALLLTTPVGALVLSQTDPGWMRVAISVVVLLMVLILSLQGRFNLFVGRIGTYGAGGIGGFVQGATGLGGPPVVAALLARGDLAATARGNVITVMSSMIALTVLLFAAYGLVTREVLVLGTLAAPFCLLGSLLGARAFRLLKSGLFRPIVLAVLSVSALASLFAGA